MKKLILVLVILTIIFFALRPRQSASVAPPPVKPPETPKILSIPELITLNANKYQVAEKTLHRVIKCESGYNPKAVGDGGHSFGLVQIHLPSHLDISKAQALDPVFAVDFLAKGIKSGKGNMWTCF